MAENDSEVNQDLLNWVRREPEAAVRTILASDKDRLHEELTGAYTKRATTEFSLINLQKDRRMGINNSVVFIADIDDFKRINDTYGHPVGDAVLKTTVEAFNHSLRSSDIFGRYAGDEFFGYLTNMNTEDTITVEERLNKYLKENAEISLHKYLEGNYNYNQIAKSIAFTFGFTKIDSKSSIEKLIAKADIELLKNKEKKKIGR